MVNAKNLFSTLEHRSKLVCSKLTELLDCENIQVYDDLKKRISELESATGTGGEGLMSSEQGEVQAALNVAKEWQVKLLERVTFFMSSRQVTPTVKKHLAKLPGIKLMTFKGEFAKWNTFWSSFGNNVDSQDDLEQSASYHIYFRA